MQIEFRAMKSVLVRIEGVAENSHKVTKGGVRRQRVDAQKNTADEPERDTK